MTPRAVSGSRAVLLDALGTLVELEPPWPRLRETLRRRHGVEVDEHEAREAVLAEMAYYRSHHLEGATPAALAELRGRCAAVLRERLPAAGALASGEVVEALLGSLRFTPYPDAAPALSALRGAGLRIAVVSNWDCSLRALLGELGLAGAVDAVVVSAEVGAAKPDPAPFEEALRRLRIEPGAALFVGDSFETDVRGAEAAGIRALLLDRIGTNEDVDVERIFSLGELLDLVEARA